MYKGYKGFSLKLRFNAKLAALVFGKEVDMQFDFEKFAKIAMDVYNQTESPYSLEEVLEVFRYYFQQYEDYTGYPHPPIKTAQITRILEAIPYLTLEYREEDIEPECYPPMIDKHFETQYRHCDYNINHFFSGRIRELRYLETCY